MDEVKFPPQHMDKWSRNERLYKKLTEMGLICNPIFADEAHQMIEAIYVSTGEFSVPTSIGMPMKRPKIPGMVGSPRSNSDNVVNFPPML